ncbi:MAG: hypothetical protein WCR69_06145 [Sulfuricurvum sp.]
MRLSADEYCKKFKISKELLAHKIRSKELTYTTENEMIFIELEEARSPELTPQTKTTLATLISLYEKQNNYLKDRVATLETKVDNLIEEKERLLIEDRKRVEQIHQKRDEQLKNILTLVNQKLRLNEAQIIEHTKEVSHQKNEPDLVDLKSFLKEQGLKKSEKKVIKKRFLALFGKDERIYSSGGKIFLDPSKYDYGDLLEWD